MEIVSTGIVTPGCNDCKALKERMTRIFSERGVSIRFLETDYTVDPDRATEMAMEYGFDDIPAFEINRVVFTKGFSSDLVDEVIDGIGN